MATIDEFKKIEMRVGTILTAEKVEGADKLLRLTVDFGPKQVAAPEEGKSEVEGGADPTQVREIRQIVSGIALHYAPESLVGKQCPFVTNLEPRTIRGLTSYGMILAVGIGEQAVLLHPDKEIPPGSTLR